jgi:hypothetical protein
VVALLVALTLAPWNHPLAFRPLLGWQTGASGNTSSVYHGPIQGDGIEEESAAWIAKNVRYRSNATADPPNTTLARLPPQGVIVWAVIFQPGVGGQTQIRLDLSKARHLDCCDAVGVAGGEYELTGTGPGGIYAVIVRVYFGSRPNSALRAEAQRALTQLELPPPR